MPNIRSFIAIELAPPIQQILEETITALKKFDLNSVRWVPVHNIHLTLKFLGDTPEAKIPAIKQVLQTITQNYSPFEIEIATIGAFPNLRHPRVVWVGIKNQPILTSLQSTIETMICPLGFPKEERAFSPHLTLGRNKETADTIQNQRIGHAITAAPSFPPQSMIVDKVTLFKSDLRPSGSIYTPLFSTSLIK